MSIVLGDSKYFGQFLKSTRKTLRLKSAECAKMFGLNRREFLRMENGKLLIPERVLEKIVCNGIMMIMCKRK